MSASSTQEGPHIFIASGNITLANRYVDILAAEFHVSVAQASHDTMVLVKQHLPRLVMIDPALFGQGIETGISDVAATSPLSRIIVIEDTADRPVDQMALFKSGAHGFIACDISPALLIKAIHSVSKGEVWVPRKLISRLIAELATGTAASEQRNDPVARKSVAKLTPRELEVAQMVHMGGNNKMIARELSISERTVKAHLSAIFRKLNIVNRLHLALFFNEIS